MTPEEEQERTIILNGIDNPRIPDKLFIDALGRGIITPEDLELMKDTAKKDRILDQNNQNKKWKEINDASLSLKEIYQELKNYKKNYPSGIYLKEALSKIEEIKRTLNAEDEKEWKILLQKIEVENSTSEYVINEAIINLENYIKNYSIHTEEANKKLSHFKAEKCWLDIENTVNLQEKEKKIKEFLTNYRTSSKIGEAKKSQQETILKIAEENYCQCHNIKSLENFIEKFKTYPYCNEYINRASQKIKKLKKIELEEKLEQLGENYKYYTKEEIRNLIKVELGGDKKILENIFSDERFIRRIMGEEEVNAPHIPQIADETPVSPKGNTDVYFFGISGSGKSCILSGLFAASGETGKCSFTFDSKVLAGNYAAQLKECVEDGVVPPPTDDDFIAIVLSSITDRRKNIHNLSLIEMPGEEILNNIALNDALTLKDMGCGSGELLSNDNQKIIFFVIDSDMERTVHPKKYPNSKMKQSTIMDKIISLLLQDENAKIMKNYVDSIHIIVTKSDLFDCAPDERDQEAIDKLLKSNAYNQPLTKLKQLCKKYNINSSFNFSPCVFTFSFGRFLKRAPGDISWGFFDFDKKDACKIIEVIELSTVGEKPNKFWQSFCNYFNS